MNTPILQELKGYLKELRLATMGRELDSELRQAQETGVGYAEFLLNLTRLERDNRVANRLKLRIREARFPLLKQLETFDLEAADGLELRLFQELGSCSFVKEHRNVILLGNSGTGKTHLATGLGLAACEQNFKTRFKTCYALVNELVEAREERTLQRLIGRYQRYDLLILDELGYVPFSQEGAELLFQVLAERHERGSVIITTNLGFADWTQVFGDQRMTAALLDRLTHRAQVVKCDWQSYRLRQSLQRQQVEEVPMT